MDVHKIADILFNLSLDMDYADSLDEYDTEVDCIEQELHSIKDSNDVLYAMLERIAWQNPDYYQWALNRQ